MNSGSEVHGESVLSVALSPTDRRRPELHETSGDVGISIWFLVGSHLYGFPLGSGVKWYHLSCASSENPLSLAFGDAGARFVWGPNCDFDTFTQLGKYAWA